jgi:RNAse (barnase) inhibitor barstar
VTLDGAVIQSPVDFYCAIGEAINGPGGYFGANLDSLADCLRGDFGIAVPFDLVWQPPPGFAPILDVLRAAGVRVVAPRPE